MAFSFLKTGEASVKLAKQEAAAAQQRREESGKMFRFWLKQGEEAKITFVDGDLNEKGELIPIRYFEHNLMLNGEWGNFYVCTERSNPDAQDPCVICPMDRPSLMALFTVIDHRSWQSKDKTKTYTNQRKIFAAKPDTFELLSKIAVKRGGLAGATFDVSRLGEKSSNVGSMFDFMEKNDIAKLQAMYTETVIDPKTNQKAVKTIFTPADYEHEIIYRTSAELLKLGLGVPPAAILPPGGQVAANSGHIPATAQVDYASQL